MIIFAARGEGMKLVFDKKFIAKKREVSQFRVNSMLCSSKKNLEHEEFKFNLKKFDFLKKSSFFNFSNFFFKGCRSKKSFFFNFSKFPKFILKNGFNGNHKILKETKS